MHSSGVQRGGGSAAKDRKVDFLRFAELLVVVVVHRIRHHLVLVREVNVEYGFGNAARRGDHKVESARNALVHMHVG